MNSHKPEITIKSRGRAPVWAVPLLAFLLFVGVAIFHVPAAHAGILSFLSALIGQPVAAETRQSSTTADSQVSQVIVLQPIASSLLPKSSSDTPPIEGGSALSPEIARMNATSTEDLNTQISIYVVRSGDNVWTVARMFNVSVNTVLWANDLTTKSTLRPGQTLVILPVTGLTHTVKSGDTVLAIAKKYGADVEDILNYNDIRDGSLLVVGSEIVIPDVEAPARTATAASTASRSSTSAASESRNWPSYSGYFACPLPGSRVTQKLHGHNGIDFGGMPVGAPIKSAADGTVLISRSNGAWNGGYGNFVVVLHDNGTQTLYAHMTKVSVSSGQNISKGQVVGTVGSTGLSTGPHLHFEIRGAQNPFGDPSLCR